MLLTFVGLPGSGKSLYNAYIAYTELSRIINNHSKPNWLLDNFRSFSFYDKVVFNSDFNDGRGNFVKYRYDNDLCVCSENVKQQINHKWCYGGYCQGVSDLPELYDEKNCLVLLDEAGTQLANMDWDKMDEHYRYFLTQHRKNITKLPKRFDIYVYTQHKDLIEITLRRISDRIYLIRPLFGFSKNPTRPSFLSRITGIRLSLYWRHEVLEGQPMLKMDLDGKPILPDSRDMLESLEFITWYYIGRKYRNCYDTMRKVNKMVRVKNK